MATLKSSQWCDPCCVTVDKEIAYLRQCIFASAYSRKKEEKIAKPMELTLIQKIIPLIEQPNIHSIKALYMGIGNDSKLS